MLGSGSSGNALLVETAGARVLVDAGIAPRVVEERLAELGVALGRGEKELDGIVATHDHGDHFGHAERLALAFGAPLFLHSGIAFTTREPIVVHRFDPRGSFRVGTVSVSAAIVPHDAAQVALRLDDGAAAFGVATDVGRVTAGLVGLLAQCDGAIVEANHCSEMLAFSDYPDVVKRRVGGGFGHLSNGQTAELAARLVGSRLTRLWLGHLSRSNNTPSRALEVVATRARRIDVDVLPSASPVALDVRGSRPYQLGLPFA